MAHQAFQTPEDAGADSTRRALLRLQRGVQRRMQAEVRAFTGGNSPAIERYYREYAREFRRFQDVSSYGELHQELLESDLIYVGDYHTLRQSQEVACRLLERAAADARPVCLALEMILEEHQQSLDAYMSGELPEDRFLEAVQYRRTWNFDWENYRPLFETARRLGVRVAGINHPARGGRGRIQERDAEIAASLSDLVRLRPVERVLVLIGDLHLASNHLPRAVDRRLEEADLHRRRLIVYQNSDALYWTLAERGSEVETQVVRLGPDRYCVMEVPPFVKLQSYLSWEQAAERLPDKEQPLEDGGHEITCTSVLEHVASQLGLFLGLPAVDPSCEVFTGMDVGFFEALQSASELGEARAKEMQLQAFAGRSCCVPELGVVYLPYFSMNHASEEAMHLVCARLAGRLPVHPDAYENFYARVLWAALGFTASKIVNPRRRAVSEAELRTFLRSASRQLREPELVFRKQVARFVLQHLEHERGRRAGRRGRLKQVYEQGLDVRLEVTFALGYLLGERLAASLRDGGLGRERLSSLVLSYATLKPSDTYFDLAGKLPESLEA